GGSAACPKRRVRRRTVTRPPRTKLPAPQRRPEKMQNPNKKPPQGRGEHTPQCSTWNISQARNSANTLCHVQHFEQSPLCAAEDQPRYIEKGPANRGFFGRPTRYCPFQKRPGCAIITSTARFFGAGASAGTSAHRTRGEQTWARSLRLRTKRAAWAKA